MSFQCPECQKTFTTRAGLTGHAQSHKVVKRVVLGPCKVCNDEFDTLVRRKNGQYVTKETCSEECHTQLRIQRGTSTARPDIITKGRALHGDRFDYSRTVYVDAKTPIIIGCPDHGFVEVSIYGHLKKHGCPKCGLATRNANLKEVAKARRLSLDTALERIRNTHGDRYQYPKIADEFNGINWDANRITIVCEKHGEFVQHPSDHIGGTGCPRCSKWVSHKERAWLDSIGVPDNKDHRQVWVGGYPVDGFDSATNTIYLYHGSFWHGNPVRYAAEDINPMLNKTYGELYERTLTIEPVSYTHLRAHET